MWNISEKLCDTPVLPIMIRLRRRMHVARNRYGFTTSVQLKISNRDFSKTAGLAPIFEARIRVLWPNLGL